MGEDLVTVQTVTPEQIDLVRKTVAAGANNEELALYLYDCKRQGVHPLDRLLHFTKRGGKYTPITSIDLMRIRAHDTGECAGISDAAFVGEIGRVGFAATVTVYRMVGGDARPFVATARWQEYYPGDQAGGMWKKMPHTMLGKCAEGLALRKAFPRQLGGLYAAEEMDQAGRPRTTVPCDRVTGEVIEESVSDAPKPATPVQTPESAADASPAATAPPEAPQTNGAGSMLCPSCHAPEGRPHTKSCTLVGTGAKA